jgi:hypothetical protein
LNFVKAAQLLGAVTKSHVNKKYVQLILRHLRDYTLNYAAAASFHVLANLLFTNRAAIGRYEI